jgi:hypothetical protein
MVFQVDSHCVPRFTLQTRARLAEKQFLLSEITKGTKISFGLSRLFDQWGGRVLLISFLLDQMMGCGIGLSFHIPVKIGLRF